MYDLGDVVAKQVTITDAAGAASDATAVTCTVTLPDGSTSTPSVSHDSTGVYSITYTPESVGRYEIRWVATGTNASAFQDIFDVRASSGTQILSLDDAKAALNLTGTSNDEELREYIEAATDLIERHIGPVIPRSVTETVSARDGRIYLSTTPVISVTSVTAVLNSGDTYAAADFVVSSAAGIVQLADRSAVTSDLYTVVYQAGRQGAVPARWLQAARVLLRHLWSTQRGSSSPGRNRGGDDYATGMAYTMPNRVLELLQYDRQGPFVA